MNGYPGESLGLPEAGPGSVPRRYDRFVGLLLDLAFVSVTGALLGAVGESAWPPLRLLGIAPFLLDLIVLPAVYGWSIGKRAVRLRIVPVVEGRAVPEQRGLTVLTAVGRSFMWLCAPFGFLVALFTDGHGRTPFDRIGRTVVVRR